MTIRVPYRRRPSQTDSCPLSLSLSNTGPGPLSLGVCVATLCGRTRCTWKKCRHHSEPYDRTRGGPCSSGVGKQWHESLYSVSEYSSTLGCDVPGARNSASAVKRDFPETC